MGILQKLIEQAKNPNGFIGSFMLKIMNMAHGGMNKWALDNIQIKDKATVLDVGCGGGKTIQFLSKRNENGKVYGIDYSRQAVKDSVKKNKEAVERGKVDVLQASVTDMPFLEHTFDTITAFQTHYFWEDLEQSMKEIFRVLKVDGDFLLVAEKYKIEYHRKNYKTKEELEGLLKKVGFKSVAFYETRTWLCIKVRKK